MCIINHDFRQLRKYTFGFVYLRVLVQLEIILKDLKGFLHQPNLPLTPTTPQPPLAQQPLKTF